MVEAENLLPFIDRIIQWVIIPMAVLMWTHSRKHHEHEKRFIEQQGEIKAVLAVLDAWRVQRAEDLVNTAKATERLTHAVEKLNERLDRITSKGDHP